MSILPVSVRESDRDLARKRRGSGWLWWPDRLTSFSYDLWEELIEKDRARGGVRFIEGALAGTLGERATTWGQKLVTLPAGFGGRDRRSRLQTLTHELRHCDEYPEHVGFRLRYVASVRFRWAVECQGVLAEMRCLRAYGVHPDTLRERAEKAAVSFARPFPGYNMARIRNLRAETIDLLGEVIP